MSSSRPRLSQVASRRAEVGTSNHVMCLDKYADIPDNDVAVSRGKRGILQMVLFLNSFRGVQIPFIG